MTTQSKTHTKPHAQSAESDQLQTRARDSASPRQGAASSNVTFRHPAPHASPPVGGSNFKRLAITCK